VRTHVVPRRPRRVAVAAVLATLASGLAAPAGPAAASISGVYEQTADSLENSDPSKTTVATCPTGAVIGGSASIRGGDGKVAISQIEPDLSTGTVTVTAKETDDYDADWKVTVQALCAPKPSGLVRVHRVSKNNSDPKTLYPDCPSGKTLLSVGWNVEHGGGEVLVNEVLVGTGSGTAATSAAVSAREDDDYAADWTLDAFLLCADPIAGQNVEYESTESDTDNDPKGIDALCENGRIATGGAAMAVSLNPATQTELVLDEVYTVSVYGGTLNAYQAAAYEEDPIDDDWYLLAYAICT